MQTSLDLRRLLWIGFVVVVLAYGVGAGVKWTWNPTSVKAVLVISCLGTTAISQLLYSVRYAAVTRLWVGKLLWPVLLGVAAAATMVALDPHPGHWLLILRLACGVAVLVFLFDCLTGLLMSATGDHPCVSLLVVTFFCVALTVPLWLGPWVEYARAGVPMANAVLWTSPATYLASLADYDYLRERWFYAHTPIGALRYSFPGKLGSSAVTLAAGAVLWGAGRLVAGRVTPKTPMSSDNIQPYR